MFISMIQRKKLRNYIQNCMKNVYPNHGQVPPELKLLGIDDFLELNYKPYRIIYQIIEKVVFIHCILDGRRDMQKLLQERLIRD